MDEKLRKIIYLIGISDLDQTIKDILIRDLIADGLTDFLREQIRADCLQGVVQQDQVIDEAKAILEESQNPAQ